MDRKHRDPKKSGGSARSDRGDTASGEPASAEQAEVASATAVLQSLVKAVRGFTIYLPNNPLHEKFLEEFRQRLDEHLEEFGDLRLDFAHDGVRCLGQLVHTHEDRRENFGFRMHADGLRSLVLAEGIEAREARKLVDVVKLSAMEASEDDVVTGLWSGDLPHVSYTLAEAPAPAGAGLLAGTAVAEAPDGPVRRFAASLATVPPPSMPLPPPPQRIFTLDERELADLQALREVEQRRTPIEDVAGILEAVIGAEDDPAVLEELLGIVARLGGDLIHAGHFGNAARLIGIFAQVAARPGLPSERAERVAAARAQVITADVLEGLTRLLGSSEVVAREELRNLVLTFGSAGVEPFCRLLGEVPGKEIRKVLIEALAEIGRDAPDLFLPFLNDSRWYLVRNTIYILRRIASPEVARAVRQHAGHRDLRVRKEVLHYLDETGDPGGEPTLLALLSDPVVAVRIAAARSLARRGSQAATQQLFALTASPGFDDRELTEREAVWEALGELAPARAFAEFKRMLLKRYWLGSGKELQETACAVAGLRRIGTPEALEVLRQAATVKRGAPRELVAKALRALALAQGAGGAGRQPRKSEGKRDG